MSRHLIHLCLILGISLSVATYMKWINWRQPLSIVIYLLMFASVYLTVVVMEFYQTKLVADQLNKKLNERFKGEL